MLDRARAALEGAGVPWRPGQPVPAADRARATRALEDAGFAALRDGTGALGYDAAADAWTAIGFDGAEPPRPLRLARGLRLCLLAPDGAGKSTLASGLAEHLPFEVRTIHMELYGRGRAERTPPGIRFAARIARQWRRYLDGRRHSRDGGLTVFDRYTYDTLLPTGGPPSLPDRIVRAGIARAIPAPDLVLILDAPAEILHARKAEHSVEAIDRMRRGYLSLPGRLPCSTAVIGVTGDADAVRRAVTARAWQAITLA
jgi:thymidylate kinase